MMHPADSPRAPVRRELELGGHHIVFDDYGAGDRTVLLLHGIPGDRTCWARVARALAAHHRVIVPDLPGFGESGDVPSGFHARQQSEVIVNLATALGPSPLHLVGFDYGGPIATLAAASLPSGAASLTLANTNVFPDTPIPAPLRLAKVPGLGRLAYRMFFGRTGLLLLWVAATQRKRAFPLREYAESLRRPRTVRSTRDVFLTSMRDLPGLYRPVEIALSSLQIPTLVVWSDGDPFFSPDIGRRVAAGCRDGTFHMIHGAGHFTPLESAEEFAVQLLGHFEYVRMREPASAIAP